MRLSKTVSFEPATWDAIERFMKKKEIKEVSHAAEQLILSGVEAEKEKEKVNTR